MVSEVSLNKGYQFSVKIRKERGKLEQETKKAQRKAAFYDAIFGVAEVVRDIAFTIDPLLWPLVLSGCTKPEKKAEKHYSQGNVYYKNQQIDKAMEEYQKSLEVFPDYNKGHYGLALCYVAKGNVDLALQEYERSTVLDPGFAYAYYGLGSIYHTKGRLDQAIREYKKAVEIKSDFVQAYEGLVAVYYKKGDLKQAAQAYVSIAEIYRARKQSVKMLEAYKKAVSIDPNNLKAHFELGGTYTYFGFLGKTEDLKLIFDFHRQTLKAIQEFKKVLEIKPDHRDAAQNLSALCSLTGENDEAIDVPPKKWTRYF